MKRVVRKCLGGLPGGRALLAFYQRMSNSQPYAEMESYNLNQLQKFEVVLNRNALSFRKVDSILEFGCGGGRLMQYMHKLAPQAQIFGCDILSDAVAECRRKCPWGHFSICQIRPPLDFPDNSFDLVYAYSVFTHLTETSHIAWLKELARVLKPGGIMLLTTKSFEFLRRASLFSPEAIVKYELPEPVEAFINSAHDYYYFADNPEMPEYGLTIIRKEYVIENWPRYSGVDVVDYAEGIIETHPEGCHDIVALMKKK